MSETNYLVLYQFTDNHPNQGKPKLWTRGTPKLEGKVWVAHIDVFGIITAIYIGSYGHWTIKITTEDREQVSHYIEVIRRDIPGKDIQPRRQENVHA